MALGFLCTVVNAVSVGAQSMGAAPSEVQCYVLQSKLLGEAREVQVALPDTYEQSAIEYPVLLLLDGEVNLRPTLAAVEHLAANGLISGDNHHRRE